MNITNTDTIDGRNSARQAELWLFYIASILAGYFFFVEIPVLLVHFAFDEAEAFRPYAPAISIFIVGGILIHFNKHFWVNPSGNKVLPTINSLSPAMLEDGGTLFTVYTAGFALKWPWERPTGKEIDIEKEQVCSSKDFTVTVDRTALELELSIAWRPHTTFLSAFLQNEGESGDILKQIIAKAKQYVEEIMAHPYYKNDEEMDGAERIRAEQTHILEYVHVRLQNFADHLGIEIFDLSFSKCDYDVKTQERLNKHIETRVVAEISKELHKNGVAPDKAPELAAIMAGVKGVELKRNV